MLIHLHVNKTNFHMKGIALGLALKQRWKATEKSPIAGYKHDPQEKPTIILYKR